MEIVKVKDDSVGHIYVRSSNDFDVNVNFNYIGLTDILTFLPLTSTEREVMR